ncbi:hypothetical protein [Spirulina sp. 06S082]|uniref:hypothetical protein n=1 Tax=Spirulina sp. 06S082 TaxID=3110248 RepID=UPI002B1EA433|nr:hypothetical protein [Spirulina sp. 06S082]MEA5470079.1 hypothetical protein [Spirulina sp. 06S082]
MTEATNQSSFESYSIDRIAHDLVLNHGIPSGAHPQVYKMRMTVAYGLERFWGEQHRFKAKEADKAEYWRQTWNELAKILEKAGISLPNDTTNTENADSVRSMAEKLWDGETFPPEQRKVALAILTQLCDSMVWWTQRYKKFAKEGDENNGN